MTLGEKYIFIKDHCLDGRLYFKKGDVIDLEMWHFDIGNDDGDDLEDCVKPYKEIKKQRSMINRFLDSFFGRLAILTSFLGIMYNIGVYSYNKYTEGTLIKPTLVELVEKNKDIQRLIEDILTFDSLKENNPDRVGVDVVNDYEKGLYIEIKMTSGIQIIATNEITKPEIAVLKDQIKSVNAFHFKDFINGIDEKDSTPGSFIIDNTHPVKSTLVQTHLDGAGVKAIVYEGIYRKPYNHYQKKYLIGAVLVSYIKNEHTFTAQELSIIKAKTETIAAIIELLYETHIR